jgi:inorganic pyrophosphatase
VIEAGQKEEGDTRRNDRLIAVAEQSLLYSETKSLEDLSAKVLEQIEAFFVNYQRVRDIDVKILRRSGQRRAHQILQKASHQNKAA